MATISENARNIKQCPFCQEIVAKGAVRCPHCHADLKAPQRIKKNPFYMSSFMIGFYTATFFWIMLIIIYIWRF